MNRERILLASIYTGYNYGTSLQANAMKMLVEKYGYEPQIVAFGSSLTKGRDIRITKLIKLFSRTWFRPALFKKTFFTYTNSIGKSIDEDTKKLFLDFVKDYLKPELSSYSNIKKKAKQAAACVCGSAQIWNPEAVYLSPLYFLRFSSPNKRIAYAPSFGKEGVPSYNKKIIKKYLREIPYISVRETQGTKLVKDLLGRDVTTVLDPTLLFGWEDWKFFSKSCDEVDYVLVYFLDEPSEKTIRIINEKYKGKKKISVLYDFDVYKNLENHTHISAGPSEFLGLIKDAKFVFTDSFHGLAFCINFNKKFLIFDRNYGVASPQGSRITSILDIFNLTKTRISESAEYVEEAEYDFEEVNSILEKEREKSFGFFERSLRGVVNE